MRAPNKIELDHSKTKPTKNNDTYSKKYIWAFFREKNTCIIGMAIILFYQIFFKSFCNWSPFELLYLLKIMKIIVAIWDNSCPMTQVLIFFLLFLHCILSLLSTASTQYSPAEHTKNQVHDEKSSKHNHGDEIDKLPWTAHCVLDLNWTSHLITFNIWCCHFY